MRPGRVGYRWVCCGTQEGSPSLAVRVESLCQGVQESHLEKQARALGEVVPAWLFALSEVTGVVIRYADHNQQVKIKLDGQSA